MSQETTQRVMHGRMLIVGAQGPLTVEVRAGLPEWDVSHVDSYLPAIRELTSNRYHCALVGIDSASPQWPAAVEGLREAAGEETNIVLCCEPKGEPLARRLLSCGADDYVVLPLHREDLLEVLAKHPSCSAAGLSRESRPRATASSGPPSPSFTDIQGLSDVLANMTSPPCVILDRLAKWIGAAVDATGAVVTFDDAIGVWGEAFTTPVAAQAVEAEGHGRPAGQIKLGAKRQGTYTDADLQKVRSYAPLMTMITGAAAETRRLWELAHKDELTGLPNRRYLMGFLDDVLSRAAAERFRVTLLVFDIDDFKSYNDCFGHPAGDGILRDLGQLFVHCCRKHDMVARLGGDEFAVVFWDAEKPRVAGSKHPAEAIEILKRFQTALTAHEFRSLGKAAKCVLTVSGGLATFPWSANDVESLFRQADEALLQAKRNGKGKIYLVGGLDGTPAVVLEDSQECPPA